MSFSALPAAARAAFAIVSSRLRAAYLKAPDGNGWRFAAGEAAWLLPIMAICGWAGGVIGWQPALGGATWVLLSIAFFFPVLAEESLFRAALIRPGPTFSWRAIAVPALLFTAWHPLQAWLYWVPWRAFGWN